jgi:hypothetical protein
MEDAFRSSIPVGMDKLLIARNMDTTSLATTFPFTSSDLTMEEGIMYGINKHNGSLVIFDRFSMENANSVVFAKSGAGKSYFVKLEALRHLVFGAQVMIIDPEEEYYNLCEVVGGNYISFSANSKQKINPFDLSGIVSEGENELGQKLLSLMTLLKLMMGNLSSTEEAILDRALIETYRIKGITSDPDTQSTREPPVMEDLYKVLLGASAPEAKGMADRMERFIKGSMTGIFDAQSNIDLNSNITVFSTKNLEEALRPIAFYMILDFVWTTIRRDLKKRILIVEEAWYLMQNEDSARFIYGIAKRARKYYLGLTTISQDVDDFLSSEYGKAVVTNSSIQMLLKQHPAAIDKIVEKFYLSQGEKRFLLSAGIGEGLFFAGSNHVAIKVMASEAEHKLITTNPEELIKLREEKRMQEQGVLNPNKPQKNVYKPYKPPLPMDEYTTFEDENVPGEEKKIKDIMEKAIEKDFLQEKEKPVLNVPSSTGALIQPENTSIPESNEAEEKTISLPNESTKDEKDFENNQGDISKFSSGEIKSDDHLEKKNTEKEIKIPVSKFSEDKKDGDEIKNENKRLDIVPPKPPIKDKKQLDSRVIELRKKMLQDDGFLNTGPDTSEIMESVQEMKNQRTNNDSQVNNPPKNIQGNP